ncbi:MAG: acyl-CoA thioesterase [Phycisphaerae bacterium]|nr:acyl-CoA thioesterase [Phycisphaerae bacterium]
MNEASRESGVTPLADLTGTTRRPQREGITTVRVRYCECDPMGVAHHASYIPWLEIGRTELLRSSGVSYATLEREGTFLVVVRLECRYRRPAFYDDVVAVHTRVARAGRVKIEHAYEIVLAEDGGRSPRGPGAAPRRSGTALMAATSVLGCVGPDGSVRELPAWLSGE